jgi:hypothetical protein
MIPGLLPPALLAAALMSTGCDNILDSGQAAFAYEARVVVDGSSAVPMRLLTSTRFFMQRDSVSGDLVASEVVGDTQALNRLPHDSTYGIRGADRFLVRLLNSDSVTEATVRLRVYLDGRQVYDQRAVMRDASLQYIAYFRF